MVYTVSQRTREIGVRIAIGANQRNVAGMVLRQGLTLAIAGAAVGVVAALVLSRLMASQLFGVQPSDPLTMAAALLLMMTVAAAAAYVPARRAARIDPIVALRE
jgi:ABC-type antimicrobial peptide transport system permease subunit